MMSTSQNILEDSGAANTTTEEQTMQKKSHWKVETIQGKRQKAWKKDREEKGQILGFLFPSRRD